MLLLLVVLHVDAFAEVLESRDFPVDPGCAEACDPVADTASGTADFPNSSSPDLDIQDFLETAHVSARLHRAPRVSRSLPDAGCCGVAECQRRTDRPALITSGQLLRAHYSLYCVYRI